MQQGHGKRRPRLVIELKVQHRRDDEEATECWSLDVGMGGMFLRAGPHFTVGDWLELLFYVPYGGRLHAVQCCGPIIRIGVKPLEGESYFGVAIEFRKFLRGMDALRRFLADQLGRPPRDMGHAPLMRDLEFDFQLAPEAGLDDGTS
jgi:hypothetical protein